MISEQSLKGKRIVVTRNSDASERLTSRLENLGADVIELPLIRVEMDIDGSKADDVFKEFAHYEWILFTSRNGVNYFFKAFLTKFEDIRSLGFVRIAAIGSGTVEALEEYYLKPELVPEKATADSLLDSLKQFQTIDNLKILVVTGNRNSDDLTKGLNRHHAIVDTLKVYRTEFNDLSQHPLAVQFRDQGADAIIFASASAVQSFGEQAHHLKLAKGAKIPALCSFGPKTSEKMKEAGIPVAVEAKDPGVEGMVAALTHLFKKKSSSV